MTITLPTHGDVFPQDALARIRDLEKAANTLNASPTVTQYWAYVTGTLSPDPATTTPLTELDATVTSQFVFTADDGSGAPSVLQWGIGGTPNPNLQWTGTATDGSQALIEGTIDSDGSNGQITASVTQVTSGTSAALGIDGDGSFSLTADDGANTYELLAQSNELKLTNTAGPIFAYADVLPGNVVILASQNIGDPTQDVANISLAANGTVILGSRVSTLAALVLQGGSELLFRGLVTAPADGDLSASEFSLWLDDTPGATTLGVKAKDSGGTVRTATIPLT